MKATTLLLTTLLILASGSANAEFRTWTRNDGKTAELELVTVTGAAGDKTGEFRMRSGRTVSLKASTLSTDDAKLLEDWTPEDTPAAADSAEASAATGEAKPSAFDKYLDGDLVRLTGKSLKACKDATKPAKYYIFYYTASWCGPCQKYTPSLVEFYKKNKNDNFELVLITSDSDEDSMEGYAKEKEMPWPQLKLSKVEKFKKNFAHGVSGIPSVVTCDLEGNIVSKSNSIPELEKLVK